MYPITKDYKRTMLLLFLCKHSFKSLEINLAIYRFLADLLKGTKVGFFFEEYL